MGADYSLHRRTGCVGSHHARTLEHGLGEFCGQGRMEECVTSGLSLFQVLSVLHSTSKDGSHHHFPSPPGYIKNTEKLNYGKEHQYKLTVTAYDCGKKRATEDVLVKISIKPTCSPGWQGELQSLLPHPFSKCTCRKNINVSFLFSLPHPSMGQHRLEQQDRI